MLTHALRTQLGGPALLTPNRQLTRTPAASRGRVGVIVNPVAGRNIRGRSLSSCVERTIESALLSTGFSDAFVVQTRKPRDAAALAGRMALDGIGSVIAVGGDGTINEVVSGLMRVDAESRPTLGILSTGTGRGFAQSLRLPTTIAGQVRVLQLGKTRTIDVVRLDFPPGSGGAHDGASRYLINECQIGFGAEVVHRTVPALKRLGGTLAFGLATLSLLPKDYHVPLELHASDSHLGNSLAGEFLGIIIANGDRAGGAMTLAPGAQLDDGQLDALVVRRTDLAGKLRAFMQLYNGSLGVADSASSTVQRLRCESLRVRSSGSTQATFRVSLDGELDPSYHTEVQLTIVPRALRVYSL